MPMAEHDHIDDILSIRNGHLFIEESDAVDLARRFGTPIYVMSENGLRNNVRRFIRAFQERWPEGPVHVLPSIKANFSLALRSLLTQEGTGCDTFGPGELFAALHSGVRPELISVNGSSKDRPLLEQAVQAGARITLDSAPEVRLVRDVAKALGLRAKVRFRVRPRYAELDHLSDFYDEDVPIRVAAQHYKPGIPTAELLRVAPDAIAAPELDVTGAMVHLGRHSADLGVWRGMVRSFVEVVAELSRACGGWEPHEIDLGGGFATPRDPTGRMTQRGQKRAADMRAPSIEDYATALTESLRTELAHRGLHPEGKVLEVEPGRSLFADAGIHLATVRNVKAQEKPLAWRWVETDTTEMFLLDSIVEHCRWMPIVASRASRHPTQTVDVVGISCGFDVIVSQTSLPEVEAGDVIAFLDTGAYQDACSNNFNALPRPATVLVHGRDAEVIKRAETVEDVFRRDIVPERLQASSKQVMR
jgi:diaminopimelate decarboxylase